MLVGLRLQPRLAGETVDVNATVPVNPFTGATVIVEVAVAPARAATLMGDAVSEKSSVVARLLKVAPWIVSGTGLPVPFEMMTQVVVPDTLLTLVHPVW